MRIVIVGAGIGGLTAALALSGKGHAITLLEKRVGFGETGAGIQLSPNATRVLLPLGLGPALARHACEPSGLVVRDLRSDAAIGRATFGAAMRERFGAPSVTMARADLHTALLDLVRSRSDIQILVGRGAVDARTEGATAIVGWESDGGRRGSLTADLVIGADGLWSRLRAAIGDARRPTATGYTAYRAALPSTARPPGLAPGETGLWLGRGAHVVLYPVSGGRTLNLVVVARRGGADEEWSRTPAPDEVAAGLRRPGATVRALVAAAPAWSAWSLFDHPVTTLSRGRVALLGDAAHPVMPYLAQGGALAIEDGAHLAALLGDDPASVPEVLRRYEQARLPRLRRVQAAARANGRAYHAGALVSVGRNIVMGRLGPDGLRERYAWLYGWTPPDASA